MDKKYTEQVVRDHYHRLTEFLIGKGLTISTMESATSGQIASLITDTEGASAVLKGAFITYSNEAKILQGVPAKIIERYTVYSRETAEAMAAACKRAYSADIGIGVTGTMGNLDPANPEASVPGEVFFAIGLKRPASAEGREETALPADRAETAVSEDRPGTVEVESFHIRLAPQPSRLMYKLAVAEEVYLILIRKLENLFPIG